MSEAKHTPGPWVVRDFSRPHHEIQVVSGDYVVCKIAWDLTEDDFANARLIAAAPDMLEALESILLSQCAILTELREKAKAAIRKAKGEA